MLRTAIFFTSGSSFWSASFTFPRSNGAPSASALVQVYIYIYTPFIYIYIYTPFIYICIYIYIYTPFIYIYIYTPFIYICIYIYISTPFIYILYIYIYIYIRTVECSSEANKLSEASHSELAHFRTSADSPIPQNFELILNNRV